MAAEDGNQSFHSSDEEAELDRQAEKLEYDELLLQMQKNKKRVGNMDDDGDANVKSGLSREE